MPKGMICFILMLSGLSARAQECPTPHQGVRISATGDILVHKALYEIAVQSSDRFRGLWGPLLPVLKKADFTVGNLEGPVAPGVNSRGRYVGDVGFVYDDDVYSGTNFVFNFHPYLIQDLAAGGFDLLTTANNHSMDRRSLGADLTIDELERAGMDFVGSRRSDSGEGRGHIVLIRNLKVGVVACTESLNGMPDSFKQILRCNSDEVISMIRELESRADAVMVFPHWGEEYQPRPNGAQKSLARAWVKAGALAVIGNHPHVLQTTEWLTRPGGGKALVIYSLGNFVAAQGAFEKRVSAVAHIDIGMRASGAEITQFSYTPIVRPSGSASLALSKPGSAEARYAQKQLGPALCE
jgi:poly-gamma-glutamate synthesis protein (capsule biosynthesis protein)